MKHRNGPYKRSYKEQTQIKDVKDDNKQGLQECGFAQTCETNKADAISEMSQTMQFSFLQAPIVTYYHRKIN